MKKNSLFTEFRNADASKGPRSSRLRLENLEDRQLLSVTDLATLAGASEVAESAQYAPAAPASDAVIDVDSALASSATVAGAWVGLSTDFPAFGDTVVASIDPDATATYAWYSVDADNVETQLSSTTARCYVASNDLLGKYLKVVATYTSGEYAGETATATTPNTVTRLTPPVKIAATVPYVGVELVSYTTLQIATVDYQWYRVSNDVETAIDGATSRFYTVTEADLGSYLKVVATGTGDFIGSTSATTQVAVVAECPLTLSTRNPVLGGCIHGYLIPPIRLRRTNGKFTTKRSTSGSTSKARLTRISRRAMVLSASISVCERLTNAPTTPD